MVPFSAQFAGGNAGRSLHHRSLKRLMNTRSGQACGCRISSVLLSWRANDVQPMFARRRALFARSRNVNAHAERGEDPELGRL